MPNLRSVYKTDRYQELPIERTCNRCGETKPREEMIVQFRKSEGTRYYYFRPRCKACNNDAEHGHRRDYKTQYLKRWRRENKAINESYWKGNPIVREQARINAMRRFNEKHEAILIQGRMQRHGYPITIAEAEDLLNRFGRCYPTRFGLNSRGLRECERIRSRLRNRNVDRRRRQTAFEIRLMVYEESEAAYFVIEPHKQPEPYKAASRKLKQWHHNQRILKTEAANA